jgi:NADH-quinone oxidoreductase subunit J
MLMTAELVFFIIVAAVAIFSAVLMLVSRNAVHSALFLVINLLCVSFLYMMLHAPFLAMVQISVYAGAIMVLFMFVIMLLGSERLSSQSTRYTWIVPVTVVLASLFLLVAFGAIVQGQVALLQPIPPAPQIRFANVAAGTPDLDVYLNNDKIASGLAYREATSFAERPAGDYNLLAFPACTSGNCPDPTRSDVKPLLAVPLSLKAESMTTFVVTGTTAGLQVLSVPTDLSILADENTWRLTAVNALPGTGAISLIQLTPTESGAVTILAPTIKFGDAASPVALPKGSYDFSWRQGDQEIAIIRGMAPKTKTNELLILAPEQSLSTSGQQTITPALIRLDPAPRTHDDFGSPQEIGGELLTTYLLAFELVALLLLTAMVGAILLTREEVVKRARRRLVVSPMIKRINRGAAPQTQSKSPTGTD